MECDYGPDSFKTLDERRGSGGMDLFYGGEKQILYRTEYFDRWIRSREQQFYMAGIKV